MGLIKAFAGSAFSYIGDMWQDYICCDSMDNDTLLQKGHKKGNPGAGPDSNDNVITQFSRIAVNAGQVLIVVEDGKIVDFTAEQGGYEFSRDTQPSAFTGSFGEGLRTSFEQMRERFAFGGIAGTDQRAYFINTKEILENRFGFGNVPYRDSEFDLSITLQGFGSFTFRICDPLAFYTNISGNVTEVYDKESLEPQLADELRDAMLPVLGELSKSGVRYDELPSKTAEITSLLKEKTRQKWAEKRGVELVSMALSGIVPDDTSLDKIRDLQESRIYSGNKAMLGARVGAAQANAMESAASNSAGAVTGFMGMGMAQNSGGVNVSELMKDEPKAAPKADNQAAWVCECGMENTMNFCPKCGKSKPKEDACEKCGFVFPAQLKGMRFCPNCGADREGKA